MIAIAQTQQEVRRAESLEFLLGDQEQIDPASFFRGSIESVLGPAVYARSILSSEHVRIRMREAAALARVPAHDWVAFEQAKQLLDVPENRMIQMIEHGLLVTREPAVGRCRSKVHEALGSLDDCFDARSVAFHRGSRWSGNMMGLEITPTSDEDVLASLSGDSPLSQAYGPAPAAFYAREDAISTFSLPEPCGAGFLEALQRDRKTVRHFDEAVPVSVDDLSHILYYTFGCHGLQQVNDGPTLLKKFVPSGGALHPTEAYPLILRVDGLSPGVYHYGVERHELELLHELPEAEMTDLVLRGTCGQHWYTSAAYCIAMTVRLDRVFWKYRRNRKAYRAAILDVGHISQAHYLQCQNRNLGAFVTGALNDDVFEECLRIDGVRQVPIAVCGGGVPLKRGFDFTFKYKKFRPGQSQG